MIGRISRALSTLAAHPTRPAALVIATPDGPVHDVIVRASHVEVRPSGCVLAVGSVTLARELAAALAPELAVYTDGGQSRVLAMRHEIEPVGKEGRANLYAARAFVDAVGYHDRSVARKRRRLV